MRVPKGPTESGWMGWFGAARRLLRQGRWDEEEDAGEVLGRETIEAMLRISRERMMGFDFRKPNNQQNNF